MSETTHPPGGPAAEESVVVRPHRKRFQVGVRTVVLLVAAIAVWMTFFVNRRQNAFLEARIASSRPMTRELDVADESQIAVVKVPALWSDELRWDVYLPRGAYRVCMATRAIATEGPPPVAAKSARVGSGRHQISIEEHLQPNGWRVSATWDETGVLAVNEPRAWNSETGSTTWGADYSVSTQTPGDQPLVLLRRRFAVREEDGSFTDRPDQPSDGVMLWIERIPDGKEKPQPPR